MIIVSTGHRRTIRELGSTESRPWCPRLPLTSLVRTLTLPITSPVTPSHAHPRHRTVLIRGGRAPFTALAARSRAIQSP